MKIGSLPIVILNPVLSSVLRFDKLTNRGALEEYILSAVEGSKGGTQWSEAWPVPQGCFAKPVEGNLASHES